MDKVQSIPNQSQIPKNGQASGKFSNSRPSNPQNLDRLWADFGPSNPQNHGQPYIGASRGLTQHIGQDRAGWTARIRTFSYLICFDFQLQLSSSQSDNFP